MTSKNRATAPTNFRIRIGMMGVMVRSMLRVNVALPSRRRGAYIAVIARHVMTRPPIPAHRRAVSLWLYAVAALMVVTLVVGGATRLT
jgi:hypothetical protein